MRERQRRQLLWIEGGLGWEALTLLICILPRYFFRVGGVNLGPVAAMVTNIMGLACVGWAIFGFSKDKPFD